MSAGNDARTYVDALGDTVDAIGVYLEAVEDKVQVMVDDEEAVATDILAELHAVEAAQRSLAGRMDSLDAAIVAQLPEDEALRPLKLVPKVGSTGVQYRTHNEGETPQWDFEGSFDPEGLYTFGTGLEVKWAAVTEDAPDFELVDFGGELPWLISPASALSVSADEEYEYEVWVETPDGRRSDVDIYRQTESGEPQAIEKITFKFKVRNSVVPAAPGLLTAPNTLRRAWGVHIGADPFKGSAHVINDRIRAYEQKMSISVGETMGWYHQYISGGQGWSQWMSTATRWLEVAKALYDRGGDPGTKFYLSVPPFCVNPMTSSDAGWATLRAAGYTSDPKSWAAAKDGAYNYYYAQLGKEIERIWGDDSDNVVLSYAWECNGDWYIFQIIPDGGATRNTTNEVNCRLATIVFHDQVHGALHPSGHRVHICRNVAGGGLGNTGNTKDQNGWLAWKNSIPTADTVSAVTGRYPVDLFTIDSYQNWWLNTSTSTNLLSSWNAFADWIDANHPTIPYGVQETSNSMVIRESGGTTTLDGAQAFPRGTVTVASTASFSPTGWFVIGGRHYKYTGKTGTTFTGVTAAVSAGITHSGGSSVKESKKIGAGDDPNWWEWTTDWAEGKRAAGRLVMFITFDVDTGANALFALHEPKAYSPVLYHMNSSPTGFYGNGTGAAKAKLISELGGSRATATS